MIKKNTKEVDDDLTKLNDLNQEIQDKYLQTSRTKKKRWMNDQIFDMMGR